MPTRKEFAKLMIDFAFGEYKRRLATVEFSPNGNHNEIKEKEKRYKHGTEQLSHTILRRLDKVKPRVRSRAVIMLFLSKPAHHQYRNLIGSYRGDILYDEINKLWLHDYRKRLTHIYK